MTGVFGDLDELGAKLLDLPRRQPRERGTIVIRTIAIAAVLLSATVVTATALADPWTFVGTNAVASSPVQGGGYPVPPGPYEA